MAVWAWDGPHNGDIWIHDVDRPARILLSENEGMDIQPVWSPDGTEMAFSSERPGGGGRDLYIKSTDRNRPPELVLSGPAFPLDWSNDKRYLLLHRRPEGQKAFSLWYLELNSDRQHQAKQMRSGTANAAAFSPDGRYVTYVANRNGTPQVYVCSFPNCDEEQRVSLDGGEQVRWAKGRGGSIYYIAPNDAMMEVDVRTQPKLTVGTPRQLFTRPGFYGGPTALNRPYDVSDDGQQFVVVKPSKVSTEKPPAIHVWQNWVAGFKDRSMD